MLAAVLSINSFTGRRVNLGAEKNATMKIARANIINDIGSRTSLSRGMGRWRAETKEAAAGEKMNVRPGRTTKTAAMAKRLR